MMKILFVPLCLLLFLCCSAQVNLNQGLIGFYPFSGNANEVTGNGVNGIPKNGPQLTTDRFGAANSAYYFDGNDDYIQIPSNQSLNSTNAFSIALYFNTEQTSVQTLIGKIAYFAGVGTQYQVAINFAPFPGVLYGTNSPANGCAGVPLNSAYVNTGAGTVLTNQWYCVVATYDNGLMKIYLNGILLQTTIASFNISNICSNADVQIGSWWDGDQQRFTGKIDDVRFYNRAINSSEVAALCSQITPTFCSGWLKTPTAPSYMSVGDLDVAGNKITVEAMFNRTAPYSGTLYAGNLVSKHDNPATVNYLLRPNSAEITTTNGYFITPGICEIQLNKTYHVAMVYDGATLKFYRDGFLMSQVAATGNLYQNNLQTRIGWLDYIPLNENFIGYINEVRIWNKARTQAEIRTYMNSYLANPTTQPGLLGYYSFDNLLNKQGNTSYNGILGGSAAINQTNPNCIFVNDSCTVTVADSIIINEYTPVLSLDICRNNILVEDGTKYNVGDTVLMIQMKGSTIDSTNAAAFGSITNYNNAGNYEFNYISSKTGNVIELKNRLLRQYDIPLGKVQLVRVPYYYNANFNSVLTCLPWDGNVGGVLAINVRDTLELNANIDIGARGFRGGQPVKNANYICDVDSFFVINNNGAYAAAKGEGIVNSQRLFARGKIANGGGGGNSTNSGGAGGGNAGNGGSGGKQYLHVAPACDPNFANGGIGGVKLNYGNTVNKIFLGGSGGAGHDNEGQTTPAGNGGGIAIISANTIDPNSFSIISNGGTPVNINAGIQEDGRSGGGAGGTVLLNYNTLLGTLPLEAKGGNGDFTTATNPVTSYHGPGGGGSGGIVWINKPTFIPSLVTNILGGINGVNIKLANNAWGATPGENGLLLGNLVLPITNILFKPNIDSVLFTFTSLNCTTFNFDGSGYTNTNAIAFWEWNFGDGGTAASQKASHDYSSKGTFTVKLIITDINGCKDSISKNVVVSGTNIDFSYKQDVCNPNSVQFFHIGNNPASTYWSFGDGSTITAQTNPVHVFARPGNYLVKYSVGNGSCVDTIRKNISIGVLQDNLILTPDTTICYNTTKQLRTQPALSFCWFPSTYLNDPLSPNPVTSTPVPITYYFTAEIPGANIITNGNFNSGNTGFTSGYNFAANNTTEGQYFVGPDPSAWNAALSNCTDHTTGNANMLLVNGSPVPDINVWKQTVLVTPNTNYAFSSWIQALYPPNPAKLSFSINGSDIGNLITASLPTCTWTQFYTTWNSGNNTSAVISIVNKNTEIQGNDFALDDISFALVYIKRDSIKIAIDTPIIRTLTDTATCKGTPVQLTSTGAVQYSWSPATGLNSASVSSPLATPADTTRYIVTGTNANGCTAKDTVMVFVRKLPVIIKSVNDTICLNQSIQLSASGGTGYSWTPALTLNNADISNPVATPANTTTYTVLVTGANNCVNKDSVKISIKPVMNFTVSPGISTCVNGKAQLNAGGGTSYLWSPAALLNNAAIANPIATVASNTVFTVIIKDDVCNLADTLFTNVTTDLVLPNIAAAKSNDMDCVFNSVQLSVTGADVYVWTPATDLSSTVIANPVATPAVTRQYRVVGTNSINNCSSADTITVFVKAPAAPKSHIPDAFTPNGDGTNDCFKVMDFATAKTVEVIIYNRYGNLVFQTKNPSECWDGKYKGQPSEPGNYVYFIRVINDCGEEIKKGNLLLLR